MLNIFKSQFPAGRLQQELQQFERVVLRGQLAVLGGVTVGQDETVGETSTNVRMSVAEHDVLITNRNGKNKEQLHVTNYQTELYSQILAAIQENDVGVTKLYERYCLDKAEMRRLRHDIRDLKNASLGSFNY